MAWLTRGISLGFQGLFPLFFTREDSILDSRVEVLLDIIGQIFDVCSLTMSEAAATGRKDLHDSVLKDFRDLAEHWDRYATTTVNDLTQVEGMKSVEAATQVARVLAEWRTAGESAGDINFWRRHVEDFDATSSFASRDRPARSQRSCRSDGIADAVAGAG